MIQLPRQAGAQLHNKNNIKQKSKDDIIKRNTCRYKAIQINTKVVNKQRKVIFYTFTRIHTNIHFTIVKYLLMFSGRNLSSHHRFIVAR